MTTRLSPASRGLLPGLLLALGAAFAVLAMNTNWLLPALDDEGLAYLVVSPQIAAGEAPSLPAARWDAPDATQGLEGRGRAMPLAMAAVVRSGRRPHVGALWALALSAALLVLTAAWVGGGVAGVWGAVAAALAVAASALVVESVTSLRPEVMVTALVTLLLGVMVYRPGWSLVHGAVAAAAWLAHPVGLGAVAAAVVWPLRRRRTAAGVGQAALAALPAMALLASAPLLHGLLVPSHLTPGVGEAPATALMGLLRWAGAGLGGVWGPALGVVVLGAGAALVAADARQTPDPPADVHWTDPAAADALQEALRPAAGLLALGLLVAALSSDAGGALARPWTPAVAPLAILGAATAVRAALGRAGPTRRLPVLLLTSWIAVGGLQAVRTFLRLVDEGGGHTASHWVSSEVIRWVDNRSTPYPVLYASDPGLVLLQSGRVARSLPVGEEDEGGFREAFRRAPGAIVLTDDAVAQAEALTTALPLVEVVRTGEGVVLIPEARPRS